MTNNNQMNNDLGYLSRVDKEHLIKQRSKAVWLTGLSGSGKTTITKIAEKELYQLGYLVKVLDADEVRTSINKDLGFSIEDRSENIRRIAEVAKMFVNNGIIVFCCFVSPTEEIRNIARTTIGEDDFIEVFVNASFDVCEQRDVKGLYQKARNGLIKNFTGLDSPFEKPKNPALEIATAELSINESAEKLLTYIIPLIRYS
jgi:adenylylsulfate kinase